jgi:hypothetical protein
MRPTHAAPRPSPKSTKRPFSRRALSPLAWLLAGAAALGAWAPAAWAASSASWASSEGVSASVGSLSASVQSISHSATGEAGLAAGTYRVVELVALPGRAGWLALRLARAADREAAPATARSAGPDVPAELQLVLPARTVQAASIAAGDAVQVRELPQGFEFAHGEPARAFFLALRQEGLGELRTRALAL